MTYFSSQDVKVPSCRLLLEDHVLLKILIEVVKLFKPLYYLAVL